MPRSKPVPTLAQLRKMSERKGLDIETELGDGRAAVELWWADQMIHFASFMSPMSHPVIRRCVYGVLSALPDVSKRGKQ